MNSNDDYGIVEIITTSIREHKMFNFMLSLLILLILSALLEDYKFSNLIIKTLSTVVIVAGVHVAGADRKSIIILLILALPWFLSEWFFISSSKSVFVSFFFFAYVTKTLLDMIIKTRQVTQNTLYASVCVYLMLGLLWASIYGLINELVPGTVFKGALFEHNQTTNEIIYFSYTTLTTLGYGDLILTSPVGRIMSILEAIIGQLFIAFMVARLVTIYTTRSIFRS